MFIKTIGIRYARKVKTGTDYGMAMGEYGVWADLLGNDDINDCVNALYIMARENVKAQLSAVIKGGDVNAFLGLPLIKQEKEQE